MIDQYYSFDTLVAGGPLFDKYNGSRLLAIAMVVTALGMALTPIVTNIWLLAIVISTSGLSMGFLDTGGNVSIVWYGSLAKICDLTAIFSDP